MRIKDRRKMLDLLPKNGVCAEIGVDQGKYSKRILKRTNPKKLHLIDAWVCIEDEDYKFERNFEDDLQNDKYEKIVDNFQKEIDNEQVVMHKAFSYDIVDSFEDKYFDWIYVDANHTYEGALQDLLMFDAKVKDDGYILGHDFVIHNNFGVIEAVNEFCYLKHWKIKALTRESFPSYWLERRNNDI
jgi:hypothetical protein